MENIIALINQCSTDKEIEDLLQEKLIDGHYYIFTFNNSSRVFKLQKRSNFKLKTDFYGEKKFIKNIEVYQGSAYSVEILNEGIFIKKLITDVFNMLSSIKYFSEISEITYNKVVQEFERQSVFRAEFLPYLKP